MATSELWQSSDDKWGCGTVSGESSGEIDSDHEQVTSTLQPLLIDSALPELRVPTCGKMHLQGKWSLLYCQLLMQIQSW